MAATEHTIPELDRDGLRKFAFSNGAVVAVLFGLFLPWLFEFGWPIWPWILGAVLAAAGLVAPLSLRPVYYGWMRFALLLSRITTPLVMGIVYYLVITPVGLLRQMFGKDPLARKLDEAESYRVESKKPEPGSLERPF